MPCVKIKQLDERVATAGYHMGGGPERRKLQPGEVVDIPKDMRVGDIVLLDAMLASGKIELTMEPATRPLDYESAREAKLVSPTFKARGPDEVIEVTTARAKVGTRMASKKPVSDDTPTTAAAGSAPTSRRAARRARGNRGAEVST